MDLMESHCHQVKAVLRLDLTENHSDQEILVLVTAQAQNKMLRQEKHLKLH